MALVTCSGIDVLRMRVHMPQRRAWWAWLDVDTADVPSGKVQINAAGGLALTGTVKQPSGMFLNSAWIRVVGGGGGLDRTVTARAFENAQLGDPLRVILADGGESLSSKIAASITSVFLSKWTVTATSVARSIDALAYAASSSLQQHVIWRVLADGTVWIGVETWPPLVMPTGADVLEQAPDEGRYVIGATTPFLTPGVNLDGVGNIVGADHWVSAMQVRTDAWI
jgi:hypothetical protein